MSNVHCLKFRIDQDERFCLVDLYLEEFGLMLRGVRISLASIAGFYQDPRPSLGNKPMMELPPCALILDAGNQFVFFSMAVRAIDRYNERRAEERAREAQAAARFAPRGKDVN